MLLLFIPVACPWSVVLSRALSSFTTKTDRHDIAEILLKVALKHQKSNQIIIYIMSQIKDKRK